MQICRASTEKRLKKVRALTYVATGLLFNLDIRREGSFLYKVSILVIALFSIAMVPSFIDIMV